MSRSTHMKLVKTGHATIINVRSKVRKMFINVSVITANAKLALSRHERDCN